MIRLYCKKSHGTKTGLCPECKALAEYACDRSNKCPFMDNKTFCSNCKVHCYKPEMRNRIRQVMRFSGPRMIFHHPVMAMQHLISSRREAARLAEGKDGIWTGGQWNNVLLRHFAGFIIFSEYWGIPPHRDQMWVLFLIPMLACFSDCGVDTSRVFALHSKHNFIRNHWCGWFLLPVEYYWIVPSAQESRKGMVPSKSKTPPWFINVTAEEWSGPRLWTICNSW